MCGNGERNVGIYTPQGIRISLTARLLATVCLEADSIGGAPTGGVGQRTLSGAHGKARAIPVAYFITRYYLHHKDLELDTHRPGRYGRRIPSPPG